MPGALFAFLIVVDMYDRVPGDDVVRWALPLTAALLVASSQAEQPGRAPTPKPLAPVRAITSQYRAVDVDQGGFRPS